MQKIFLRNRFIPFILYIILFFGCATGQGGAMTPEPLKLNNIEREFIDTQFNIVINRDQIRGDVISKLSGKGVPIANPGEKYNDTDLVDFSYPSRMILFAGESNDLVFVHYMQGGFVSLSALYLAKFDGNKVLFECNYFLPKANTLDELKNVFMSKAQRDKNFCHE